MTQKVHILDSGSFRFILEVNNGRIVIWPYESRKAVAVARGDGRGRVAFRKVLESQAAWRPDKGAAATWCRRFASDAGFRKAEIDRFAASLAGAEGGGKEGEKDQ